MTIAKHAVTDHDKLASLVDAMQDGWPEEMPPVLVAGEHEALTGSHRLAAANIADIEPVILDIQDAVDLLIKEEGYTWEEILGLDDFELADALETIGRQDLAIYARPSER